MFWNIGGIHFLMYNTLIAIVEVFLSDVSQPSFPDGMFVPFQLYVLTKGSFFLTLSVFFSVFWWFNATIATYWKHLLSFLLMVFIAAFLICYPIRGIYIWSTTIKIYLMVFIIQQINKVKDEIITFHRCFKLNLRSRRT